MHKEFTMTTPSAFSGAIRLEIEFRVLGIMSKRRVQVNYTYTPPWPFLDADAATERSAPFALGFSLAVLTQPEVASQSRIVNPSGFPCIRSWNGAYSAAARTTNSTG